MSQPPSGGTPNDEDCAIAGGREGKRRNAGRDLPRRAQAVGTLLEHLPPAIDCSGYATRSLSTHDTTVLAPGSNVSCLSTRRETSQRFTSSLLSRMATAIRVPSGETRGTDTPLAGPTAVSFPLRSIHASVRRALTAGRYTNVPESATANWGAAISGLTRTPVTSGTGVPRS